MKVFIEEGIPVAAAAKLIRLTIKDYFNDPQRSAGFSTVYGIAKVGTCSVVVDFVKHHGIVLFGDINTEAFPPVVEDGQHRGSIDDSHRVTELRKALLRRMRGLSGCFVDFREGNA